MAALGWGIVGLGRIARTRVAPAIVDDGNAVLVAGASRSKDRAEDFARTFGARSAYDDYERMLADPAVDAVFIATPNALHPEAVVAAARAGKHVLCDKPLALGIGEAVRAVQACRESDVLLGMNFHYRHMPWVRQLRDLVRNGAIGRVRSVHAEAGAGVTALAGWRGEPGLAGLGTVHSHGVHVLDVLRFAVDPGGPVEVTAMFDDERIGTAVETHASVTLRLAGGAIAHVASNQTVPYPANDLVVQGTDGTIVGRGLTRAGPGTLTVTTRDGERTTPHPEPDAHRRCVEAFTRAVLAGEVPDASGLDGLHSVVLCDAIARSVGERRRVELPGPATIPLLAA